jgi:hypothetical protein
VTISQVAPAKQTSVVVNDLDFVELSIFPDETDAIPIVNSNAVLSFSFAAQRLKVVSWRNTQIIQIRRVVQVLQLSQGYAQDIRWDAAASSGFIQLLRIRILEVCNHD